MLREPPLLLYREHKDLSTGEITPFSMIVRKILRQHGREHELQDVVPKEIFLLLYFSLRKVDLSKR
jgi:hypothetical protein